MTLSGQDLDSKNDFIQLYVQLPPALSAREAARPRDPVGIARYHEAAGYNLKTVPSSLTFIGVPKGVFLFELLKVWEHSDSTSASVAASERTNGSRARDESTLFSLEWTRMTSSMQSRCHCLYG